MALVSPDSRSRSCPVAWPGTPSSSGWSRSAFKEFGRALVKVLEEVDVYTQHHSVRVAEYSLRLARAIGLPERSVAEIEHAALLHDIGKIGPLHQYILDKPGRLTEDEESTIREHPVTSAKLVSRVRSFRRISEIVLAHHERPDGRGYPYGLGSDEVPIGAGSSRSRTRSTP
jgi:putative nucleotidyltransferase with HDIG domain